MTKKEITADEATDVQMKQGGEQRGVDQQAAREALAFGKQTEAASQKEEKKKNQWACFFYPSLPLCCCAPKHAAGEARQSPLGAAGGGQHLFKV